MPFSSLLLLITEYIGLATTAMSGTILGIKKGLDIVGVWFLALVSALGGGVLRDVLLGDTPPRFFRNYPWVLVVSLVSIAVLFLAKCWKGWWRTQTQEIFERVNNVLDSIGLAAFTLSGIQLAISAGHMDNVLICTFMGTITGIGGGIMRDVMVMQTPKVLRKRVYALVSIFGGVLYWLMLRLEMSLILAWLIAMTVIVLIRTAATHFLWNLPHVDIPENTDERNNLDTKELIKK